MNISFMVILEYSSIQLFIKIRIISYYSIYSGRRILKSDPTVGNLRKHSDPINFDILLIVQFSSVLVAKVLFECIFFIYTFIFKFM